MDNLHKEPSLFECIIGSVADGTSSNIDNDFDKTIGGDGEGMSASDFVIKGDGEIIFVSAYKSDNEIKSVIWGSGNARVGCV